MYAIWLSLEKKDEEILQSIIDDLGKKYDAPSFKPHITVYGLVNTGLKNLTNYIEHISNQCAPFDVELSDVSYSEDLWKTLFLNLKPHESMTKINQILTERLNKFSSYYFTPHISLIYKHMPIQLKQQIIQKLELRNHYRVEGISIDQYSEKIEDWKIVSKFSFLKQSL